MTEPQKPQNKQDAIAMIKTATADIVPRYIYEKKPELTDDEVRALFGIMNNPMGLHRGMWNHAISVATDYFLQKYNIRAVKDSNNNLIKYI